MTTQEIIDYYANLLVVQYITKERARAHVKTLVSPVIADQIHVAVQNAFNLDDAVGVHLDIIGKYAGVVRTGNRLNGDPIVLDDDDFRSFIKMAVIRNSSTSDLYSIQKLLNDFFPGQIYAFDHENMQMSFFMLSSAGSPELAEMFLLNKMFPKPMGVELSSLIYSPSLTGLFGMVSYGEPENAAITGMNAYATGLTTGNWLSYDDTITIS